MAQSRWVHDFQTQTTKGHRTAYEFEWSPETVVAANRCERKRSRNGGVSISPALMDREGCQQLIALIEGYSESSRQAFNLDAVSVLDLRAIDTDTLHEAA